MGYFAALAYIMVAGTTVMNALGQSAAPRLARYYVADRRAFLGLLQKMLALALMVGIGGVLIAAFFGRQVLSLLYKPDYAAQSELLAGLMTVAVLTYVGSMLGCAMTFARAFRPQVPLLCAASVGILAVCLFGFQSLGIFAAVVALMFGGGTLVIGSIVVLVRAIGRAGCHWRLQGDLLRLFRWDSSCYIGVPVPRAVVRQTQKSDYDALELLQDFLSEHNVKVAVMGGSYCGLPLPNWSKSIARPGEELFL